MSDELLLTQDGIDGEIEREELQLGPSDVVVAVAGAGDRVLTLLGAAPKIIFAVDPSPPQAYLLELKLAGLKALSLQDYLELVGARESRRRRGLYQRVRWLLTAEADGYWMGRSENIDRGILSQGAREQALSGFRRFVTWVQGTRRIGEFLELSDPGVQRERLRREWDGFVWRTLGGRMLAGAFGASDPAECLRRLEASMTSSPARDNHLLSWLLAGRYVASRPPYLDGEAFDALKLMANRIVVGCAPPSEALRALPAGFVTAFALGDGMDRLQDRESLLREIGRVGSPGARILTRSVRGLPEVAGVLLSQGHVGRGPDRTVEPGRLQAVTLAGTATPVRAA